MAFFVLAQNDRQTAHTVTGGDKMAVLLQDKDIGSAVDDLLSEADTLFKRALLVNHSSDELIGVDPSAGHGVEMTAAEGQILADELIGVVDDADGTDGVDTQIGPDEQRLGIAVADAADCGVAGHLVENALKLGPERSVFNVVDLPLETDLCIIGCHAAPAGAEVGMVVSAEKDI